MVPHPWEMRIQLPWKMLVHPISWRLLPQCQYNIDGNLIFCRTYVLLALVTPSISVHTVHVGLSLYHLSGTLYWHITSTHDSLSDVVETMVHMFHIYCELFFVSTAFEFLLAQKTSRMIIWQQISTCSPSFFCSLAKARLPDSVVGDTCGYQKLQHRAGCVRPEFPEGVHIMKGSESRQTPFQLQSLVGASVSGFVSTHVRVNPSTWHCSRSRVTVKLGVVLKNVRFRRNCGG